MFIQKLDGLRSQTKCFGRAAKPLWSPLTRPESFQGLFAWRELIFLLIRPSNVWLIFSLVCLCFIYVSSFIISSLGFESRSGRVVVWSTHCLHIPQETTFNRTFFFTKKVIIVEVSLEIGSLKVLSFEGCVPQKLGTDILLMLP